MISDYLDESLIVFLEEDTRDQAIERLVLQLDDQGKLPRE